MDFHCYTSQGQPTCQGTGSYNAPSFLREEFPRDNAQRYVSARCDWRAETLVHQIQVRYRKGPLRIDPHMQNSMRKLKLTLTLTDTGGTVLTLNKF